MARWLEVISLRFEVNLVVPTRSTVGGVGGLRRAYRLLAVVVPTRSTA